jgi:hypothetical protein
MIFMGCRVARKDDVTQESPGVAKRPGRPSTGKALTAAERQARRREKLAAEGKVVSTVVISREVQQALAQFVEFRDVSLGDVVDRILRGYLLRKR